MIKDLENALNSINFRELKKLFNEDDFFKASEGFQKLIKDFPNANFKIRNKNIKNGIYNNSIKLKGTKKLNNDTYSLISKYDYIFSLKDNKRGKLVGKKSFGKGLVQSMRTLVDGSGLTVAKYLTPNGTDINKFAITPDIEVKMNSNPILQREIGTKRDR